MPDSETTEDEGEDQYETKDEVGDDEDQTACAGTHLLNGSCDLVHFHLPCSYLEGSRESGCSSLTELDNLFFLMGSNLQHHSIFLKKNQSRLVQVLALFQRR